MQISSKEINTLIVCVTIVFLIAPVSLLMYVGLYNRRKKNHREEKELMKLTFEAEMIKAQLEAQEQTMQTIGADLHDNIGQLLSLTSLTLNSINIEDAEKSRQKIEASVDLTNRSIKEMRLLGKLLQGEQLVNIGLEKAIRHELDWIKRMGHLNVYFAFTGTPPHEFNAGKDLIMFRMVQEIINNCLKHAKATQLNIELKYEEASVWLVVEDNGVGFSTSKLKADNAGMGLHNIVKRAKIIDAKLDISSTEGTGTKISIHIPYP